MEINALLETERVSGNMVEQKLKNVTKCAKGQGPNKRGVEAHGGSPCTKLQVQERK